MVAVYSKNDVQSFDSCRDAICSYDAYSKDSGFWSSQSMIILVANKSDNFPSAKSEKIKKGLKICENLLLKDPVLIFTVALLYDFFCPIPSSLSYKF